MMETAHLQQTSNRFLRLLHAVTSVIRITPVASVVHMLYFALAGLIPTIQTLLVAKLIDVFSVNGANTEVFWFAGALCTVLAWNVLSPTAANLLEQYVQSRLACATQSAVWDKALRLNAASIENRSKREVIERIQKNGDTLLWKAWSELQALFRNIVSIVSLMAVFFRIRWWISPAFALVCIPLLLLAIHFGQKEYKIEQEVTARKRTYRMLHDVLSGREASLEREMFGYSEALDHRYLEEYENARRYQHRYRKKMFIRMKTTGITCAILALFLIAILLFVYHNGGMSTGMFVSLSCSALNLTSLLLSVLAEQFKGLAYVDKRLSDLTSYFTFEEVHDLSVASPEEHHAAAKLEITDVSFSYPDTEKDVLRHISLSFETRKTYAIVGVNGAGKTTLFKLLTKQYENYTGDISMDGQNLHDVPMESIRNAMVWVPQFEYRFAFTIRDLLCMGQSYDDDRLWTVLRQVGMEKKVRNLPRGLQTYLGRIGAGSSDLSGGEWQRLGIARALLRPFSFILLDEPTSALDPVAENDFLEMLHTVTDQKGAILISHRLSAVKNADYIYVLDAGELVEQGSFEQLLQKDGLFSQMYVDQKAWYAV